MKKPLFLLALFASFSVYSQVGINTETPQASLEILAMNATGSTTNAEGLLIPRVDRQRAQSMTGVTTSTLIYINDITTGTATGTAVNIDAPGYYYFDETNVWTKLKTPVNASADINIYKDNGTLLSNRIVSQEDKTLAFTSTATTGTNHFSVDGTTFSADAVNNRIGIGTATPLKKLHVNGALQLTNELNVGGDDATAGTAGASGQILKSNGAGAAPAWTTLEDANVVQLSTLALKNSTYQPDTEVYNNTYAAGSWNTVVWNTTPKIDNTKLVYNNTTGLFTVVKAGYYQVLASTHLNMSLNPTTDGGHTSGTAQTVIKKNTTTIASSTSSHGERTDNVYHTVAGAAYFNSSDTISLQMIMTRRYRIAGGDSFITITYLGQ